MVNFFTTKNAWYFFTRNISQKTGFFKKTESIEHIGIPHDRDPHPGTYLDFNYSDHVSKNKEIRRKENQNRSTFTQVSEYSGAET